MPRAFKRKIIRTRIIRLASLLISVTLALVFAAARGDASGNAGGTAATQPAPNPSPQAGSNEITFHNNTMADFSATSGEPIIKVDKQDRIFVTTPFGLSTTLSLLWRSSDGGRSYVSLGGPVQRDAVLGPGGGDTDVDFDDKNRVYYIDLSGACVTAAVSEDGGNTFPVERTNHVSCVSDTNPGAAIDDRQWIVGFGDGTAYATWRNLQGSNFWMFKTTDAGRTWDKGRLLGAVGQSGPLRIDKQKRRVVVGGQERDAVLLYQVFYTGNNIRLFRVTDIESSTPIVENFSIYSGNSDVSNVFPVLAVDSAGNLYAAWSQAGGASGTSHTIWMATSTDRGQTWSPRKQVSTFTGTNIMPWIVAGDPGRADIVWYRGSMPNNPNNPSNTWQIYMAQTLNAFDANPTFNTVAVSQNLVHRGEICTAGLECDYTGRDRSFLEYPSVWIDSKGAAVVTYNDNTNQSEGAYVMVAKQKTGPSLYTSVGGLGTEPGTVSIANPSTGTTISTDTMTIEGAHTIPPKNFDRDETGDARYKPTTANLPGADLRAVSLKEEGDSLVLTMEVADLTSGAINNAMLASEGSGMLYLTQWDYNDTVYWLGAEVRGGQTLFYTGTLGMIRSATSKKFVTYNPDLVKSQQVTGQISSTSPGSITIRVPKSVVGLPPAGAQFHTLTGYALSERAPLLPVGSSALPNGPSPAPKTTSLTPDPTSLPVQLDASGAATYTTGEGMPLLDGIVEVSLDDADFLSPRTATLSSDLTETRWRLPLSASELTPGAHTVYVRQRIAGREYSPVASAAYNVSETIERLLNSQMGLETRNVAFAGGVVSYDLLLRNNSAQTVFTPLRAQVASINSASGNVTVANADNKLTGAGATFEFGNLVGGDGLLAGGEQTGARRLRFNNPSGEGFTVVFNVYGHLPRALGGSGASGASSAEGSGGGSGGSGSGTSSSGGTPVGALVEAAFKVTYNPLLGKTTVELIQQ